MTTVRNIASSAAGADHIAQNDTAEMKARFDTGGGEWKLGCLVHDIE